MTSPAGQSFPCRNCGAQLQYDAATRGMACQFCGHKEAVQPQAQAQPQPQTVQGPGGAQLTFAPQQQGQQGMVRDIPLEEGMRMAARGLGVQVATIQCKDCGATVNVGQGERTTQCAFCGSKQVLSAQTNEQ